LTKTSDSKRVKKKNNNKKKTTKQTINNTHKQADLILDFVEIFRIEPLLAAVAPIVCAHHLVHGLSKRLKQQQWMDASLV
jgi:hypothetical protein